jgi:hypothetical protein
VRVRQQFSFACTCTVGAGEACDLFFCIAPLAEKPGENEKTASIDAVFSFDQVYLSGWAA